MWFSKIFLIATLGPVRSIASCASHFLPEFCSGQLEYNSFFFFFPRFQSYLLRNSTRWNLHRMILMTMVSFQLRRNRKDPKIRNDAWSLLSTMGVSVLCELVLEKALNAPALKVQTSKVLHSEVMFMCRVCSSHTLRFSLAATTVESHSTIGTAESKIWWWCTISALPRTRRLPARGQNSQVSCLVQPFQLPILIRSSVKTCHSVVVGFVCVQSQHTQNIPKSGVLESKNVDTHKWKASHFFVQASRNTRSWRNLLTADCRHKYILVSPCYKTSIKAFMAATTQSCSDIERTPSSDRTPRRKFWTLNKISKRSGQNGPELSGLWTHHKTSLRPQHMPMARQAWKWMCLMCSITPTSTHVSSGFEERYYPPTPRNVPWQEYMTKHALFCITYLFGNGCLKHSCQHWHVTDQIDW